MRVYRVDLRERLVDGQWIRINSVAADTSPRQSSLKGDNLRSERQVRPARIFPGQEPSVVRAQVHFTRQSTETANGPILGEVPIIDFSGVRML